MSASPRQLPPEEFPPLLREIHDPPKTLRAIGDLPRDRRFLTVVGSRKYSPYGRRCCETLIASLRSYPVAIVSGLALGIDALAHEAALKAGLPTVAVLPCGLSPAVLYPASNRALAARIVAEGGTLLSEFPDEFKPQQWSFLQRNRIMAGMSSATLIIETSLRSGTLVTARLAMECGRDVLTIPFPIDAENGAGNNSLIRDGAALIRSADDILEALQIAPHERDTAVPDLSPDETAIFNALSEPLERESLIARTDLPAPRAGVALSQLLLKGLIIERMGRIERII